MFNNTKTQVMFKNIKKNIKEWETTAIGAAVAIGSLYMYLTGKLDASGLTIALALAASWLGLSVKNNK